MLHKIITAFLLLIPITYFLILTNPAPMPNEISIPTETTIEEDPTEPQGFAPLPAEEQKRIQNFIWNPSPEPAPLGETEIINLIALSLLPLVYFFGIKYIEKTEEKSKKTKQKNEDKKEIKKNKKAIKKSKNKKKKKG